MRHARFVFVVVLVAGLLISCAAVYQGARDALGVATNGNITATAPAALMAEVATMEPTAIPSPTVDTIATQIALVNQIATQQAEINAYQEQIRQINIESKELDVRKIEAQAASNQALADKARAEADKAAQDAIKADIALKMAQAEQEEIEIKTAMVSAVTQQKQAETGRITNIAMIAIVAAFVVLGAIAMFRPRAQTTTDSRDQEVITNAGAGDDLPTESDIAQINHSQHEAYLKEIAITREEKAFIRRAAVEYGGRFSNETMTPKDKFFSDYRWRQIEDLLLDHSGPDSISYAVRLADRSVGLTSDGWDWLGLRQPPPSPAVTTPENAQNTAIQHHTTPQNTEGEVKSGGEGA